MKYLHSIDILGPKHKLFFMKESRVKTWLSSLLSLLLISLCLLMFLVFSADSIQKRNPSSRFSKEVSRDSEIYLEAFPVILSGSTGESNIDFNYFELTAQNEQNTLEFVKCSLKQHFSNVKHLWKDSFSRSLCLSSSGENKIGLSTMSPILTIKGRWKGKNMYSNLKMRLTLVSSHFNLNSIKNPLIEVLTEIESSLNSEFSRKHSLIIEESILESDEGLLLRNNHTYKGFSVLKTESDLEPLDKRSKNAFEYSISLSELKTRHNRVYPKIQASLAETFAVFKLLICIGKLLCSEYSEYKLFTKYERKETRRINQANSFELGATQINLNRKPTTFGGFLRKKWFEGDLDLLIMQEDFDNYILSSKIKQLESTIEESRNEVSRSRGPTVKFRIR